MKRQISRPNGSDWQAIARVASEYHSSAKVKMVRRPNKSDSGLNTIVPMNMPLKVDATSAA